MPGPGSPPPARAVVRPYLSALERNLAPHGVAVHLEAVHPCTQMPSGRETEPTTRTSFWRGNYDNDPQLRAEFFGLCSRRA